tara:strand:- start:1312 stop:1806 length:495 start_codon:yes stop_codon:yes gene_type:complete
MRFKYSRENKPIGEFILILIAQNNGQPIKITLNDVHFPFGMNTNHSIKLDILDMGNYDTHKAIDLIDYLDTECVAAVSDLLGYSVTLNKKKVVMKRNFVPNVLAHIHYKGKHLMTDIVQYKGLPIAVSELKGYRASLDLEINTLWIKNKTVYGKWKINKIKLKM